jgi:hypothetical protein
MLRAPSFADCVQLAREALDTARGAEALERLQRASAH